MLRQGIPVGTFFGVSVRLHYSWFIIFLMVTILLAVSYFPSGYPDWARYLYWVIGIVTSVLFFLSVLAHELAHSLVARSAGIPVKAITLFIFGGVSQIDREPDEPGIEFRIALAGPLTSLVISGVFWGIWAGVQGTSEPVAALAFWLGWINAVLAGFNLIPGFPLDGGRVLRALMWWRSGDLRAATRTAANIGKGVGYLFIFAGVGMMFWGYLLNGIWIAFIGWFLQNAAGASYRQMALQSMLRGHKVREIMTRDCPSVAPSLTVEQLVHDYVLGTGRRCFPVVQNGRVLGLATVHDLRQVPRDSWPSKSIGEVMTPFERLHWVGPDDELTSVLQVMTSEDLNQLPVVENGSVVGMVGRDNLLSFIQLRDSLGL